MRPCSLYIIKNLVTEDRYAGISVDTKTRWKAHRRQAFEKLKQSPLYNAMRKYGIGNFEFSVIEVFQSQELAFQAEIKIISEQHFKYNQTAGGEGMLNPSAELRAKLSAARKGKSKSPEHAAKVGLAHRGKKLSEKQKELLRQINTGKTLSPEAKKNLNHTGEKFSQEHKSAISEAIKKWHAERKAKGLGMSRTKEQNEKTSATLKRRFTEQGAWGFLPDRTDEVR